MQAVHVVEPANLSLAKNLTLDQDHRALTNDGAMGAAKIGPRTWNDAVFVKVHHSLAEMWHQLFPFDHREGKCTRHAMTAKGKQVVSIVYYCTDIMIGLAKLLLTLNGRLRTEATATCSSMRMKPIQRTGRALPT